MSHIGMTTGDAEHRMAHQYAIQILQVHQQLSAILPGLSKEAADEGLLLAMLSHMIQVVELYGESKMDRLSSRARDASMMSPRTSNARSRPLWPRPIRCSAQRTLWPTRSRA